MGPGIAGGRSFSLCSEFKFFEAQDNAFLDGNLALVPVDHWLRHKTKRLS
jgi:hypothetical protein